MPSPRPATPGRGAGRGRAPPPGGRRPPAGSACARRDRRTAPARTTPRDGAGPSRFALRGRQPRKRSAPRSPSWTCSAHSVTGATVGGTGSRKAPSSSRNTLPSSGSSTPQAATVLPSRKATRVLVQELLSPEGAVADDDGGRGEAEERPQREAGVVGGVQRIGRRGHARRVEPAAECGWREPLPSVAEATDGVRRLPGDGNTYPSGRPGSQVRGV